MDYYTIIKDYLQKKNINAEILKNPASNILYTIGEKVKNNYGKNNNYNYTDFNQEKIEAELNALVSVDDKGSVKATQKEYLNGYNCQVGKKYMVDEQNNLVITDFSAMPIKKTSNSPYDSDRTVFTKNVHTFDENGIEQQMSFSEFTWHTDSFNNANNLVEQGLYEENFDYQRTITTKRNHDLGSASVVLTFPDKANTYGCNIQLYGEHIDKLTWSAEASHQLSQIKDARTGEEFLVLRKQEPALNFSIKNMEKEEIQDYYNWINGEIENVIHPQTRQSMAQLAQERDLVSTVQSGMRM